jgi:hypothetical protein
MVNNFTKINKTNNHFSPQPVERKKSPLHIVLEIQVFTLGSGQAQKFDGVKPVNGID